MVEGGHYPGGPLSMAFFAIAIVPLIDKLSVVVQLMQVWFADDASAGGKLRELRSWWDKLTEVALTMGTL